MSMPIQNHSSQLRLLPARAFRAPLPLVLILTLLPLLLLAGCGNDHPDVLQGYVEGEFVYVAAPIGGQLEYLAVKSGQTVAEGEALFTLERSLEAAGVREAEKKVRQAGDRLADLTKGLRPTEIAALRAKLGQAQAGLDLAESEFRRRETLFQGQTISKEELDKARTDFQTSRERVRELRAELKTAGLGARTDEVKAAKAEFEGAEARLAQAQWSFDQKAQAAPGPALVFDLIYRKGEWVPAGRPVVCLLPPEGRKVRFFVPEPELGGLAVGQEVTISFDGTDQPVPARISYISPQAEFTPPVIYSSQSRAKLVFMIEAGTTPDQAARLHPGQPVDVRLGPPGRTRTGSGG